MYARDTRKVSIPEKSYVQPNFYEKQLRPILTKDEEDLKRDKIIQENELIDLNMIKLDGAPFIPPRVILELESILPFEGDTEAEKVIDCLLKKTKIEMDIFDIRDIQLKKLEREYDLAKLRLQVDEMERLDKRIADLTQKLRVLMTQNCVLECWLIEHKE